MLHVQHMAALLDNHSHRLILISRVSLSLGQLSKSPQSFQVVLEDERVGIN